MWSTLTRTLTDTHMLCQVAEIHPWDLSPWEVKQAQVNCLQPGPENSLCFLCACAAHVVGTFNCRNCDYLVGYVTWETAIVVWLWNYSGLYRSSLMNNSTFWFKHAYLLSDWKLDKKINRWFVKYKTTAKTWFACLSIKTGNKETTEAF